MNPFKPGDRVRLTARKSAAGYERGYRGRVVWGPHAPACGKPYYVVMMEASRAGRPEVFTEDEIGPDAPVEQPEPPAKKGRKK